MMKQVFLYSDDPIAAKGLEAVLAETGRFRLTDVFCRVPDLVARLAVDVPDIVLLDLTNEMTSTALSNIKKATNSRLVLWANSISTELAFEAMGLGVCGILRRTLSIELQVKCLQKVTEGEL